MSEAKKQVHVIKDESLGGIEREYVGESEILVVKGERHSRKVYGLAPTDIVHVDGERYRMVDRKAEVGEKVLAVKYSGENTKAGDVLICSRNDEYSDGSIDAKFDPGDKDCAFFDTDCDEYRVLEPVADELITVDTTQASPEVIDLLANLARRVTSRSCASIMHKTRC